MFPLAPAVLLAAALTSPTNRRTEPLTDIARAVPEAVLDLRYATASNFLGHQVYPAGARCLLLPAVADRLARAATRLRAQGLRLLLWDCYRPLSVQREMWKRFPRPGFVANPAKGSNHNRAAAVDVGLAAADGSRVELPTDFDTFERTARADATVGVSAPARRNRDLLRAAMEAAGFRVNRMEWWHFDAPEARRAPVLDLPLAP